VPDWVQAFACDMLLRESDGVAFARYIPSFGGGIMVPPEKTCSVSFGWDPSGETRAEAERRIMATMRESLNEIEADARRGGLVERPEIRQAEHFDWTVRFQVRGESVKTISDSFHGTPDERTIRYGIERTLKLVEFRQIAFFLRFLSPTYPVTLS